jgi:hypothetical protein
VPVGPVAEDDEVTRFVFQRSSVRGNGTIKANAFYPNSHGRCSVAVTTALNDDQIDAYAIAHIVPHRGPVVAFATIRSAIAWENHLDVQYSEPPPNHANIQGFAAAKDEIMLQAQELAAAARVRTA